MSNHYKFSLGYNRTGQEFFDLINGFRDIHSYYFHPYDSLGKTYQPEEEYNVLKKVNTHGITGNILFNLSYINSKIGREEALYVLNMFLSLENLNIKEVTVTSQEEINLFKSINKNLKFHISTMVKMDSFKQFKNLFNIKDVYCVNLNRNNIFNLEFMKELKESGILVKLIPNESCVYNQGNGVIKFDCRPDNNTATCGRTCVEICKDYKWYYFLRQSFNERFLQVTAMGQYVDIIKLATRPLTTEKIKQVFNSFFNNKSLFGWGFYFRKGIPDEFIKMRVSCNNNCIDCNYCSDLYYDYFYRNELVSY